MSGSKTARSWAWGALLVAMVLAAYWPVLSNGWIWDDDSYVTSNFALRDLDGLRRIWLEIGTTPQYYPLVHTCFWVEYHLWGYRPLGFHLVNVLVHGVSAVLLWRVLMRIGLSREEPADTGGEGGSAHWLARVLPPAPAAWMIAALFAVHPLEVESVAWVTERKNVLMGLFYLSSLYAYLRFALLEAPGDAAGATPRRRYGWHAASLGCFVLALLSKTVASSLPVSVLMLTWWRRGRVGWRDVGPLLPFFLIGLPMGLLTSWMEKHRVGAVGLEWSFSIAQRVLIAGRALWFYLWKMVWPVDLSFIYPRWAIHPGVWWQWCFPVAAAGLALLLWIGRKRLGRGPAMAAGFYAVTIAPALGFFNVYPMLYSFVADHFQYAAGVGLMALIVGGGAGLARRFAPGSSGKIALAGAAALWLMALGILTNRRCLAYAEAEALWTDTVQRNPAAWMAHNNLGVIRIAQGRPQEGEAEFLKALEAKPAHAKARANLADSLFKRGQIDQARAQYERALADDPALAQAHYGMGILLESQGLPGEAKLRYLRALQSNSSYPEAHNNLGTILAAEGDLPAARAHLEAAVRINPEYILAYSNLGAVLTRMGDTDRAIAAYHRAIELDGKRPGFHVQLAGALLDRGRSDEAVASFERAVALAPGDAAIRNSFGVALAKVGRVKEAVGQFEEAVRLQPESRDARANLERARALLPSEK